ncbi:MAG: ABC transporter ATP-binding protein, partial [Myxococcales bacterium]|nr:ABC transporter ATP-binding protein [Myxococcales bacterium]
MTQGSEARPPVKGALSVGVHEEEPLGDGQDLKLLRKLVPYLRPHAALFVLSLLLIPFAALGSVVQPYLIKKAIDAALVSESGAVLMNVVALFGGALVLEFGARFAQTYSMQLAGQRAMAGLRRKVFGHIQQLRIGYFDSTPVGRVVTRVTNDVDALSELFSSGAVTAVADLVMLFGIVAFMFYLNWELTLVVLLALAPLALVIAIFRRFARSAFRDIRTRVAQLNAFLAEQVQGIGTIQAFGREARCAAEYRYINAGYRDAHYRAIRYDALLYSVVEAVSVASVAVVLWYAGTEVGAIDDSDRAAAYVGTVVAFYEYIQRFFIPIRDLSTKYTIIQQSLAS